MGDKSKKDTGHALSGLRHGLGRAGTVAARILIERGMDPEGAIKTVRRVRPGAIETFAQEAYVRGLANGPGRPVEGKVAAHAE